MPRKIVVKIGSALLSDTNGDLDMDTIHRLASQIVQLRHGGTTTVIVSSGAVATGRSIDRVHNLPRTALAALGQTMLTSTYAAVFRFHGITVSQTLFSREDLNTRAGYLNARNILNALLGAGVVPLVNENDPISSTQMAQKVYFNNDLLAAMVANAIDADLLVLLGRTAGLFDADPAKNPNAKLVPRVERITSVIEGFAKDSSTRIGTGGMISKLTAAKLSVQSGIKMVIASGNTDDVLIQLANGEPLGTLFAPKTTRREARKRWMMTGVAEQCGNIVVDDGAATALRERGVSLLPAGISTVSGDFNRGDIVGVNTSQGETLAFGLANYSASDMRRIKGCHSHEIGRILPQSFGTEAIHRNNLTMV